MEENSYIPTVTVNLSTFKLFLDSLPCDFKTKPNLPSVDPAAAVAPARPPRCSPQTAALPLSCFVTARLSPQQVGGKARGSPATLGPVLRPHTGPTLMRCSCFQIQPLILILFLFYSPLFAPLLNPRSPEDTSDLAVVFIEGFNLVVPALL